MSLREHNEVRETPRLIARIRRGEQIALVTDAGTPGIADPGARLVRAAHDAGLRVVPIPGPSAVTSALSVSGFSEPRFTFMGFPPRSGSDRERWFMRLSETPGVAVFFEAPHRIDQTIGHMTSIVGDRSVVICREITKINEHVDFIAQLNVTPSGLKPLGEFVVVVGPKRQHEPSSDDVERAVDLFGRITHLAGVEDRLALSMVSSASGLEGYTIKNAVKKRRILVKQQNKPES